MAESYGAALEIREAIHGLTTEVRLLRLLLADLSDQGAGERFPAYIRVAREAWRQTVTDIAAEFKRLLDQRDLAAYRVVGAVQTVILFWEAQDYDASLDLLKQAFAEFRRAESRITEFRNSYTGELTRHGNHTAA